MIGVYDYTVLLTYLSLVSAGVGIMVSLNGTGHPYLGVFFLLLCGLLDAFDGKVARTKKNRSNFEKKFGIQIDSLADLVAFGVLPACIGNAMIRVCPTMEDYLYFQHNGRFVIPIQLILFAVLIIHILATLIRLAYFNVTEEERQQSEEGGRKYYIGLPVTSAALVFPTFLLLQYIIPKDITPGYFVAMIIIDIAFLSKFRIKKAGGKGIMIMVAVGAVEFILLAVFWYQRMMGV